MIEDRSIRRRLIEHMQRLGIERYCEPDDLPVEVVSPDAVPVRGSMHLATGNLVSRDVIDRQFRKARFRF